jgi:hypothetical protein
MVIKLWERDSSCTACCFTKKAKEGTTVLSEVEVVFINFLEGTGQV